MRENFRLAIPAMIVVADLAPCHPSNEGNFKVPQTVSFPSNSDIAGAFINRFS